MNSQRKTELKFIDLLRKPFGNDVFKDAQQAGVTAETFTSSDTQAAFIAVERIHMGDIPDWNFNMTVNWEMLGESITSKIAESEFDQIPEPERQEANDFHKALIDQLTGKALGVGSDLLYSLADLPNPMPETENPLTLFRNGYLRKGGGMFLVSPSGQGKSSASIQCAIGWAMGKSIFGIEPVRPLKIVIIQAEDDAEEMAFFRNQITDGLVEDLGFDRQEIFEAIKERVLIHSMNGCTGENFSERLGTLLDSHPDIDLVIVNPLLSFAGCDLARPAEATKFFREHIDPVIKPNGVGRVGIAFVHHTNKPPQAKDRNSWGSDVFSSYVGSGAADITNWARAMLALMPCENLPGVFRLVAGKRGKRLGWTDASGNPTTTRYIAHSERRIFWRDAEAEEISKVCQPSVNKQEEQRATLQGDAKALAAWACNGDAKSKGDLHTYGNETTSQPRTKKAIVELFEHPEAYNVAVWQDAKTMRGFIGLPSAVGRKLEEIGKKHAQE